MSTGSGPAGVAEGLAGRIFCGLLLVATAAVLFAAASVLAFTGTGSQIVAFATFAATISATTFAGAATARVTCSTTGGQRYFWAAMLAALLASVVGKLGWYANELAEIEAVGLGAQNASFVVSYLLSGGALVWLVAVSARRMGTVAALDGLCAQVCAGLLAWCFVLGPATAGYSLDGFMEILRAAGAPMSHATLLCLSLVALSSPARPPFVRWLAAFSVAILAGDGLYLAQRQMGPLQAGSAAELGWAAGTLFVGIAAVVATRGDWPAGSGGAYQAGRRPAGLLRSTRSSWERLLGPVAAPALYGLLLAWAALNPPVPAYVLWGGTGLMALLAIRTAVSARANEALKEDRERLARTVEQRRISGELHDSVKQSVQAVRWLLDSHWRAREAGRPEAAETALRRASEAAHEAGYRVSRPVDELRAASGDPEANPNVLLSRTVDDLRTCFGTKAHLRLRTDPQRLSPERVAAFYRIASEALWNAARHGRAENVWLTTREQGRSFFLEVGDDGRGFECSPNRNHGLARGDEPESGEESGHGGSGLGLMRARAAEAGGTLRIASALDRGTKVLLCLPLDEQRGPGKDGDRR